VDKGSALSRCQEAQKRANGDQVFNEAFRGLKRDEHHRDQTPNNPQTRSHYAAFARLDGEIRRSITATAAVSSSNTEPMGEPKMIRVVGMLANGMIQRRFQVDMP